MTEWLLRETLETDARELLLVEKSHFDRQRFGETAPPELRSTW
jgi:hypothetical protein